MKRKKNAREIKMHEEESKKRNTWGPPVLFMMNLFTLESSH